MVLVDKKVLDLVEYSRSTLALSSSGDEKVFIFMSVGKSHGFFMTEEYFSCNYKFFMRYSSILSSSFARRLLFYADILKYFKF